MLTRAKRRERGLCPPTACLQMPPARVRPHCPHKRRRSAGGVSASSKANGDVIPKARACPQTNTSPFMTMASRAADRSGRESLAMPHAKPRKRDCNHKPCSQRPVAQGKSATVKQTKSKAACVSSVSVSSLGKTTSSVGRVTRAGLLKTPQHAPQDKPSHASVSVVTQQDGKGNSCNMLSLSPAHPISQQHIIPPIPVAAVLPTAVATAARDGGNASLPPRRPGVRSSTHRASATSTQPCAMQAACVPCLFGGPGMSLPVPEPAAAGSVAHLWSSKQWDETSLAFSDILGSLWDSDDKLSVPFFPSPLPRDGVHASSVA
jgi:hypothetical protein